MCSGTNARTLMLSSACLRNIYSVCCFHLKYFWKLNLQFSVPKILTTGNRYPKVASKEWMCFDIFLFPFKVNETISPNEALHHWSPEDFLGCWQIMNNSKRRECRKEGGVMRVDNLWVTNKSQFQGLLSWVNFCWNVQFRFQSVQ